MSRIKTVNEGVYYHPKMLKIFSKEELDNLEQEALYSINCDGNIDVMIISRSNIMVEIYTDCDAKDSEIALITLLDDRGNNYPNMLTKDEFWKLYINSDIVEIHCITVNE